MYFISYVVGECELGRTYLWPYYNGEVDGHGEVTPEEEDKEERIWMELVAPYVSVPPEATWQGQNITQVTVHEGSFEKKTEKKEQY